MAGTIVNNPVVQFFDNNGNPLAGGKITTYLSNTTTPESTWQDEGLSVLNTNPIILNSRGEATIWLTPDIQYTFVLTDANDNSIQTVNDIYGGFQFINGIDATHVSYTPAGTGAVATKVETKLRESVSVKDFGAVGDGSIDDTNALQAAINAAVSRSKSLYLPTGTYKTTSGLSFGAPIRIFGDGADVASETGTIIKPTQSSGIVLEFTNAAGSFDNGLILEDFAIIGTGTGTAVGLEVNGAVWTNSRIRNITVRSMGGRGVVIDDCLTANFEQVRVAGCGSDGFYISGSNGIRLYGCMSESNAGYGYYFSNNLTAGERNGPLMLACHAEENTGGDAVYMNQYSNPMIQGCWLQAASSSNVDRATIHLDTCTGAMVMGNFLTSNAAWSLFQGVKLTGTLFSSIIGNNISGFDAARAIVENSTSGRNFEIGNRGDGTQGAAGVTSTSSTGSVFHTHMGSGSSYGQEWTAGYHSFKNLAGTEVANINTNATFPTGVLTAGTASVSSFHKFVKTGGAEGDVIFDVNDATKATLRVFKIGDDTFNAGATCLALGKNTATNRSINTAGTVNTSGADYAEYENNNGLSIEKGSIVGFDSNGALTLTYSQAVRFGIKSTDPSFVGGDSWALSVGPKPDEPVKRDDESDEHYACRIALYNDEFQVWEASFEAARARVDRVAYSGKVPVNVTGAAPGDYIVASSADDGSITGEAVANPDFGQYKRAVGRVNKVLPDGRAEVAVIVH